MDQDVHFSEEELYQYILDISEGVVNPKQALIREHIENCPQCQKLTQTIQGTKETMRTLISPEIKGDEARLRNLKNYQIIEKIGEGGMGSVWKAQDMVLNRLVSLKLIRNDHSEKKLFKSRFIQEAQILSALDHPNIVRIYHLTEVEGETVIIMEFIEGSNLREIISNKRLRQNQILPIISQILLGLQVAHAKGILHRDIKPDNVMITPDKKVRILDFGLAKSSQDNYMITQSYEVMGTVRYMAPEVLQGAGHSVQSDIYSLGILWYDMLRACHPEIAPSISEFIRIPFPSSFHQSLGISSKEHSIIASMCSSDLSVRYSTIEEILKNFDSDYQAPREESTDQVRIQYNEMGSVIAKAKEVQQQRDESLGEKTIIGIGKEMGYSHSTMDQALHEYNQNNNHEKEKAASSSKLMIISMVIVFIVSVLLLMFFTIEVAVVEEPKKLISIDNPEIVSLLPDKATPIDNPEIVTVHPDKVIPIEKPEIGVPFSENFNSRSLSRTLWPPVGRYSLNDQNLKLNNRNAFSNHIICSKRFNSWHNCVEISFTLEDDSLTNASYPLHFATHLCLVSFYNGGDQWHLHFTNDDKEQVLFKIPGFLQRNKKHQLKILSQGGIMTISVNDKTIFTTPNSFRVPMYYRAIGEGHIRFANSIGTIQYDDFHVYHVPESKP
ncbi:MAG: serine/threonine protein kinase [Planctomycetes bacterium]|nr:serine/threonine protein kinase [Planctomycetota bacterium]